MSALLPRHLKRHRHFYVAAALGVAAFFAVRAASPALAGAIAGDVFYCAYLAMALHQAFQSTPSHLRKLAETEDEGIALIILIAIAAICFSLVSLFAVLNDKGREALLLPFSVASAPLGWLMLHSLAAFHYGHRYYAPEDKRPREGAAHRSLKFPGGGDPNAWDFLYFSFVVGMTAQVSDVQVTETKMRQFVWLHGLVSFFFNTVLIALAVNIAVALAAAGP